MLYWQINEENALNDFCGSRTLFLWFSVAKQSEKFTCQPGNEEGKIICNMEQKPDKACFKYQLNLTANDKFVLLETAENTVVGDKLKPGLTYSISIVSVAGNGSSTIAQTTNATASKFSSLCFVSLGNIFDIIHHILQAHVAKTILSKWPKVMCRIKTIKFDSNSCNIIITLSKKVF